MTPLFVVVPTFGTSRMPYNFTTEHAILRELNEAALGAYLGSGGTEGFRAFGYRVADEAAARDALARVMAKHLPGGEYHIRVNPGSGCGAVFEILKEFAPKRFVLRRADGRALGNFVEVQARIRGLFPGVQFVWTASGPERIRTAAERGHPLPDDIRQQLESMPSVLEAVAEGDSFRVKFDFGHQEPIERLLMTPLGCAPELQRGLAALEEEVGATFQASEGPTT